MHHDHGVRPERVGVQPFFQGNRRHLIRAALRPHARVARLRVRSVGGVRHIKLPVADEVALARIVRIGRQPHRPFLRRRRHDLPEQLEQPQLAGDRLPVGAGDGLQKTLLARLGVEIAAVDCIAVGRHPPVGGNLGHTPFGFLDQVSGARSYNERDLVLEQHRAADAQVIGQILVDARPGPGTQCRGQLCRLRYSKGAIEAGHHCSPALARSRSGSVNCQAVRKRSSAVRPLSRTQSPETTTIAGTHMVRTEPVPSSFG